MVRAAQDTIEIVADGDLDTLSRDMIRTRALVNCFTEIGEAAARTTPAARALAPGVPWPQVVGMRNVLVHVYWGIDLREVLRTVQSDLPPFIAAIQRVLKNDSNEPNQA